MALQRLASVLREPFVRNSLKIWGACAFVFALASTVLTLAVVQVSQTSDDDIEFVAPYVPIDLANGTGVYAMPAPRIKRPADTSGDPRDRDFYEDSSMPTPPQQTTEYGTVDPARMLTLSGSLVGYEEEGRHAWLRLTFPHGVEMRFLINHLIGATACRSVEPADPTAVTAQPLPESATARPDMWLVSLEPARTLDPLSLNTTYNGAEYPWAQGTTFGEIECSIRPRVEWETFARQRLSFAFYKIAPNQRASVGLTAFVPTNSLNIDLSGVDGAEEVSYVGGFAADKMFSNVASPEHVRSVGPGEPFEASWEIVNRAQERDAILVIIGSLIALAAAMIVEAIRPVFERLLTESQAASPGAAAPPDAV
jgi:hypothetical protein